MSSIPILHEDEHLLVVDKPAGMLVVAAPGRSGSTIVEILQRQLSSRVYAVHRLDEDTTGVLLFARSQQAKVALEDAFRKHSVERTYLAMVSRTPSPRAGRIESRLRETREGIVESVRGGEGRRAVTHYRTLRRLEVGALVECRLETGRRNQIRVHMADIGCPIIGDRKYGFRPRGRDATKRPLLHAWKLHLSHPVTAGELQVEAPVPEGFAGF